MTDFFIQRFYEQCRYRVKVSEKMWEERIMAHDDILKLYCTGLVARRSFLSYYKNKLEVKLDDMDVEEKTKLKAFVNKLLPNQTPEFRLEACKIIFTINQLL